ncbi:WD40 repeat-like protein [Gymnopus androsaceus JB14]|uniref:WD40 repeat-like protein n=1 Tax=Gymnopus androsaceus JB14 TaxID=1447944 RepID=A0A6A4H6K2_9AGAR|nr:WD40 repeat-like protein [Gymnopus androsaceus JB14]
MDKTIRIWNAETGEQVVEPILGHTDRVTSVGFSSDGKRVVSGSYDKTIRIWNVETREQAMEPRLVHTDSFISVGSVSERQRLISGPDDKTVWIQNEESTVNTSFHAFARQPDPFAMTNGWVHGKNSELLFWVPPQHRMAIWRPITLWSLVKIQQS